MVVKVNFHHFFIVKNLSYFLELEIFVYNFNMIYVDSLKKLEKRFGSDNSIRYKISLTNLSYVRGGLWLNTFVFFRWF